ncbi:MAG: precorrin-8X methylmutase [Candidatus Bathyarchaeia archaeon]
MSNVGLILVGHGSRSPKHRESIEEIAEIIRHRSRFKVVEVAFMIKNRPTIDEAIGKLALHGIKKAVLIPVFIASGSHTDRDIPEQLGLKDGQRKVKRGDVEIIYGEPIGPDRRLAEIIEEKALKALESEDQISLISGNYMLDSNSIYEASIRKIRSILGDYLRDLPPEHAQIIERVVHATADPELAKLVVISSGAIETGIEAIKAGAKVVTDVKMVKAGINEAKLRRFGGRLLCYVNDERAIKLAYDEAMTRTAAAIRIAVNEGLDGAIAVISNAPTAAFELVKAIKAGEAKPALIIATPVGFIGAKESKEEILKLSIPHIVIRGHRGGSPAAVAIFNALLNMAEEHVGG